MAQEFLKDEEFYLQIDTHSLFVGGWDVEQIVTWMLADDADAVMTTYPLEAGLMPDWQKLPPNERAPSAAARFSVEVRAFFGRHDDDRCFV